MEQLDVVWLSGGWRRERDEGVVREARGVTEEWDHGSDLWLIGQGTDVCHAQPRPSTCWGWPLGAGSGVGGGVRGMSSSCGPQLHRGQRKLERGLVADPANLSARADPRPALPKVGKPGTPVSVQPCNVRSGRRQPHGSLGSLLCRR